MLAELHKRDEGQPPRGQPGVAPRRKQRGKVLVLENRAPVIPQGEIRMAFGKGGMRNTSGLLGNGANGLRAQGHHGGPSVNRVEA
jgi:hypothetical protein